MSDRSPILTHRWTPLKPHPQQAAAWRCQNRFVAIPAGRGSGKTELAKRRLVRFLPIKKPWPDPRYFYGAPTEHQAKRVAWNDLIQLTPPHWIRAIILSELKIVTIFGSSLQVMGLDKPQRAEGVQWDGCVLDESCDLKPGIFDLNIFPALTHRNGWCWRIGVPKRQGPSAQEYKKFYEDAVSGEIPDAAGFTWKSSDIVPPAALDYARAHMDPKDYREQFDASFETAGGLIFYAFEEAANVRPCPYRPDLPIIVGSDFNVDPMAWVMGHRYDNRMEWFDEIWLRDTNTNKTLNVLFDRYQHHKGGFEFYGDPAGRARDTSASSSDYQQILSHEGFEKLGRTVRYTRAHPSLKDRFAATNAMFCNAAGTRRMFVDPKCKRLIDDLTSRYYKPGTSEPADEGDLGHITDALGYPIHLMFPVRADFDMGPQGAVITKGGK